MANTRSSTKRARQSLKKQARNKIIKSITKTAVKHAVESISSKEKDLLKAQLNYKLAIQSLSKAASKGAIPKKRASRKISRITHLAKKTFPQLLSK